jgi:hypothetical protein
MFPQGISYDVGMGHGLVDVAQEQMNEWKQTSLEMTAKCVCAQCNNGWMSDIEEYTQPILSPLIRDTVTRRFLTDEDQGAIAVWAILRSVVFDSQMLKPKQYWLDSERAQFMATLEPPANTHVWLASFPGNFGAVHHVHSRVSNDKVRAFEVVNGFVGQAAFQVFHWRGWPSPHLKLGTRTVLNLNKLSRPEWRNLAIQIWPSPSRRISWPPPAHLTNHSANALMDRLVPRD